MMNDARRSHGTRQTLKRKCLLPVSHSKEKKPMEGDSEATVNIKVTLRIAADFEITVNRPACLKKEK